MKRKLELGRIVITANANNMVNSEEIKAALLRHSNGDWGEVSDPEKNNSASLNGNDRIISVYYDSQNIEFWIITEANRSMTTILLPEDY
jgi:hypothetical protein